MLPMSGSVIWLCPLGLMSQARRNIFRKRVAEMGGETVEEPCERVTHVVVSACVSTEGFLSKRYTYLESASVVGEAWLVSSLREGKKLPVSGYEHMNQRECISVKEEESDTEELNSAPPALQPMRAWEFHRRFSVREGANEGSKYSKRARISM